MPFEWYSAYFIIPSKFSSWACSTGLTAPEIMLTKMTTWIFMVFFLIGIGCRIMRTLRDLSDRLITSLKSNYIKTKLACQAENDETPLWMCEPRFWLSKGFCDDSKLFHSIQSFMRKLSTHCSIYMFLRKRLPGTREQPVIVSFINRIHFCFFRDNFARAYFPGLRKSNI